MSCRESYDEVDLLLEEAKTMWRVGAYHENIVNLQGMTVGVVDATIHRVCSFFSLSYRLVDYLKK